jgi:hypothetical protein
MSGLGHQRLNETLELLSHPYRRHALYHLQTTTGPVDIDALTEKIARWAATDPENDQPGDSEAGEIALRHTHLPKLDAAGVISVSPNPGQVTLAETSGVGRFLDQLAEIDGRPISAASD